MGGIKDLVGLLYWMDNQTVSTMEAVSSGKRSIPKNKLDIIQHFQEENLRNIRNGFQSNAVKKIHKRLNGKRK